MGHAVQADEEQLRVQLETLQAELNAPTQFKVRALTDERRECDVIVMIAQGRLNELMSQLRMHNQQLGATRADQTFQIDGLLQGEIKQVGGARHSFAVTTPAASICERCSDDVWLLVASFAFAALAAAAGRHRTPHQHHQGRPTGLAPH